MERTAAIRPALQALAGGVGLAVGTAAAYDPRAGLMLAALVGAVLALRAPTAAWVGGAVALVLLVRVGTSAGLAPAAAVQAPILVAWTALALALVRSKWSDRTGVTVTALLALLIAAVLAAGLGAGTEPIRGLFYISLIGTPFALLGAMLLDPPTPGQRRLLIRLLLTLLLVQIPFVLSQTAAYGVGDFVRGTLVGSDIGAHQIGAVAVVGALWIALTTEFRPIPILAILLLAAIPFAAAANQVIFALPIAVVVAAILGRSPRAGLAIVGVGAVLLLLLLAPGLNSDYARNTLDRLGESVKAEPALAISEEIKDDGRVLLFGQGPGTTVSSAALLTTEQDNDLITSLSLEPATFPVRLESINAEGSIQRPISSLLGLAGDLGLVGAASFAVLVTVVLLAVRRTRTPLTMVALFAIVLLLVLGFFNDALEQPPFAFFVAVVVGLALTAPDPDGRAELP